MSGRTNGSTARSCDMKIRARVANAGAQHEATVATDGQNKTLTIPPKTGGSGSSVNGGELLFLALATCYCNDVYREAARAGIEIVSVEVEVEGTFGAAGEAARDIVYRARVVSPEADRERVQALLAHTDSVAEIQNTLRAGAAVRLAGVEVNAADAL